jgi:hypothetical protein
MMHDSGEQRMEEQGAVTRRTVILAGAPQYAGVAMATAIVPAVARASTPARDDFAGAVGHRFEATSEYGRYGLTLAAVESLSTSPDAATRFGLMFAAGAERPPAGVYRLTASEAPWLADAQLFVASDGRSRTGARRLARRR